MAYFTNKLIADAYFISGILARELETLSGQQSSDGLQMLNEVIALNKINQRLIPYDSTITFTSVIGQETYNFPNLLEINTLTFVKDSVRFQMSRMSQRDYLATSRANNIQSLPSTFYFENEFVTDGSESTSSIPTPSPLNTTGGKLSMYFTPDQAYVFTINGILALNAVTLGVDLSLTLDTFVLTYLKLALAERLCTEYAVDMPHKAEKLLAKYENLISTNMNRIDLSMQKESWVSSEPAVGYYGWANLGKGWTP